ncbi:division/cell wall cluster transcriptional repressor MraZ [Chloroflexota bacterium]|nr:division/cell wall cluster transcriptional repressor MraZ [Anaerolineaceae bacterium]QRN83365.1 division/cell wall cluster transcriptional repressor MraZ [Chloroflexota bacterium]
MFLGQYEHNIDEKGRITIPAEFREELGDCVVITQGYDGNLQALPLELYELLAERIRGISILDPDSRRLRRIFFSYAKKIEFDKAGRVLLPAFLRDTANLKENAILVGNGEYFELWSPENWQVQQTSLNDVEANEQRFKPLDLTTLP